MSTVLAFDFGLKRVGVAVGNMLIKQAQPLTIIHAATNTEKFLAIARLIDEWQPRTIVVGLPLHPDGTEHEMSTRCRRFANQITGRFGVVTVLVDERYTSAVFSASHGEHVDSQAAALILQQFFDTHELH